MDEQIDIKLNQGYLSDAVFRMIFQNLMGEIENNENPKIRIEAKKAQFKKLLQRMEERLSKNESSIRIEDQLVLMFVKNDLSDNFIPDHLKSKRVSFNLYCDCILEIIENHPDLSQRFNELFYHSFLITYTYFDLLLNEHVWSEGEVENYVKKLRDEILSKEKQHRNKEIKDETKRGRVDRLIKEYGFEGELNKEQQLSFYKELTEKNSDGYYTLMFLRKPLIDLLSKIELNKSNWQFQVDLFNLIRFLNINNKYMSDSELSTTDKEYKDANNYKYKMSVTYFGELK